MVITTTTASEMNFSEKYYVQLWYSDAKWNETTIQIIKDYIRDESWWGMLCSIILLRSKPSAVIGRISKHGNCYAWLPQFSKPDIVFVSHWNLAVGYVIDHHVANQSFLSLFYSTMMVIPNSTLGFGAMMHHHVSSQSFSWSLCATTMFIISQV